MEDFVYMNHSKFLKWLAAAVLGISAAAFSAGMTAEAATGTGITESGLAYSYDTETGEATITGYSYPKSSDPVTIPSDISGYTVTAINKAAFMNCKMTSVSFPSGLTDIGQQAFDGCNKLQYITFASTSTNIGRWAFMDCRQLYSVTLPSGQTSIGTGVFQGCTNLKSITLPASLTMIGGAAFAHSGLTSITIPKNVALVGGSAFSGCLALKTVRIKGAAELRTDAFEDCIALTKVYLSDSSRTECYNEAFVNCPNLTNVNGYTVLSYQNIDGHQYPVLNPAVSTAILNHFSRSINVKFVNDYCTALCNYIVETETDPWMGDALKARQLHDWLIRHCEYEDGNLYDSENHVASSVFLSYALNVRGEGIGETVCSGYTKAYTMLLSAAGIESYPIQAYEGPDNTGTGHAWNLVKINNGYNETYYETDVTWDDHTSGTLYGTMYTRFLQNHAEMQAIHDTQIHLQPPTLWGCGSEHPLLSVYTITKDAVQTIMANATESFKDNNHDGIYDDDFDLSGGYMNSTDWTAYYECLRFLYGDDTSEQLSKKLPEVFYYLHQRHMSFWEYLASYGPSSQTVHAGEMAHFSVNLFGNGLTYQWKYWDSNHWVDLNDPSAVTSELSLTATPEMNGKFIICFIRNKEGILFYPDFVRLTVN